MKKLKRLSVKVTHYVDFENVSLPDNVHDYLVSLYDSDDGEIYTDSSNKKERKICDWLTDKLKEEDSSFTSYEIDDLETY